MLSKIKKNDNRISVRMRVIEQDKNISKTLPKRYFKKLASKSAKK